MGVRQRWQEIEIATRNTIFHSQIFLRITSALDSSSNPRSLARTVMFCSSLRQRKDWASAPTALLRAQWKETKLDTHDAGFPILGQGDREIVFRLLLFSTLDATKGEARERIERLNVLNGGAHIAIILLLVGDDAMTGFAHLQMNMLTNGFEIPMVPIMSNTDIVPCLDNLRKQCVERILAPSQSSLSQRHLLSHCINGQPLDERQTNMVMDLSSGFKELTADAFDAETQQTLFDLLGNADGERLISFFREGPVPARD